MSEEGLAGLFGCLLWTVLIIGLAFLGDWAIGYNLEVWLGYAEWSEVNKALRLLIGLLTFKFGIPLAIVGFLLSLPLGSPIL